MAILTDEIKEFIVKGLACYDTPTYVAESVRVNFGIEVTRQQVHEYDPACARPPAQRWRDLHAAIRAGFLREAAAIGVANKTVRLRRLDRLANRCERNSVALALTCLRQAAMECGGMYENRRAVLVQVSAPATSLDARSDPLPRTVLELTPRPQLPDLSAAAQAQALNANRQ